MKSGIISYDITSTRERNKLAKILCGYGRRVQFSVFEFELEHNIYEEMFEKIVELYKEHKINKLLNKSKKVNKFSIRIYELCSSCKKKMYCFDKNENIYREVNIF